MAQGGLGQGPHHRTGSAVHRGTRVAGNGACGTGGGLAAPTSSLGIISEGSRLSETLDWLVLPTHSGFELRPCFGCRKARLGQRGRMGLHLHPRTGTETRKASSLPSALPLHHGEGVWRERPGLTPLPPRSRRSRRKEPSPRGCELRTAVQRTRLSHSSPIPGGAGLRMVRQVLILSTTVAASPLQPRSAGMLHPMGSRCPGRGGRGMLPTCPPPKAIAYPEPLPPALPGEGLWLALLGTGRFPAHLPGRG